MKLRLASLVGLVLLGSCATPLPTPPFPNVSAVFKQCETDASHAYPVRKKLIDGNITPTPVCRFDPILGQIGCSQALVQKQTEYDTNDEFRRAYFYECARTKFETR